MNNEQLKEIARACAKAKLQSSYAEPFEPHEWVMDALLAVADGGKGEAVATLHDDGYWTWKKGATPPHESNYAGWRMDVYAAPTPERADAEKDAALTNEKIEAAIEAWFYTDGKDVDDHQSRMRAAILAANKT